MLDHLARLICLAALDCTPAREPQPSLAVTWHATINYGAGYTVTDEHGAVVASSLSSAEAMQAAQHRASSSGKDVMFQYWAETSEGLESIEPFGSARFK